MIEHIRDNLVGQIATQLETITTTAGYSRSVAKVYKTNPNSANVPSPAVVLVQGNEDVTDFVGPLVERNCNLNLTFVDNYTGSDPDGEALKFLSDIQRAVGQILTFTYTADRYSGGSGTGSATLTELGSSLNYSEAMRGKIYGTVSYALVYRTSSKDPRKLP
jgi:hypothetical protein